MKGMKKLLSILMVLTLVLSLGASAFALDITIDEKNGGENEGTYKAYQLFTLTTTAGGADGGEGYSYTVNEKYASILYDAAGLTGENATGEKLLDYISKLDATGIRDFADTVYESIKGMDPDATAVNGKFEGIDQGYYLIIEEGAAGGATSQVMLDTAGRQNITVNTKEDVPSSEKKVKDVNDSTDGVETGWQDSADWDIGDQVPFQLSATIPAGTTTPYETYNLIFHDNEDAGLTFNKDSVKVYLNGAEITDGFEVVAPGADCTFEVVFDNVKGLTGFVDTEKNVITVEYTSELNENAKVGYEGNLNKVHIEYSNNPYEESTGKTPDDTVIVFTYDVDVNKTDGQNPLDGAQFELYKVVQEGTEDAVVVDESTDSLKALYNVKAEDGTYPLRGKYVKSLGVTVKDGHIFYSKGIDDGEYWVVETEAPDGYNAIDPQQIIVEATHDVESENPQLTELKDNANLVKFDHSKTSSGEAGDAIGQAEIENHTGVELPETGGIGTTIFYIAGAILVAGAVIILVTKRRVSGAEK